MSTVRSREVARESPVAVAAVLTIIAYVVVVGTLYGDVGLYPTISESTVGLLSHIIAAVNTATIACLLAGWYWIRADRVRRHRLAMLAATGLIVVFLVLYLTKTGGGGRKEVVAGAPLRGLYLGMLGVHIVLSMLAVPLVLYALTLAYAYTPAELKGTRHARVGRVAATAWLVSLALGVAAFLMLTFFYGAGQIEFVTGMG